MSKPLPDLSLVLFSGIGDHVLWLGLLPHVRRTHRVIVTCAPAMEGVARLYPGSYDELRVEALPDAGIEALKNAPVNGRHLAWHGSWRGSELDWLARHNPNGTVADVIRDILGVPGAEIVGPASPPAAVLPLRTVLLAPFAHTAVARLPDQWWAGAAAHLTARGFIVMTNVANMARGYDHSRAGPILPTVPGTQPVAVPLAEIGQFAELCGFVLCARSGLSDLLARANCRMTVVWPRDEAQAAYHDRHFAAWSVARIYGSTAREVWVDQGAGFDPGVVEGW